MAPRGPNDGPSSKSSSRGKNTSRERRRVAREKASAGFSDQAHPRKTLAEALDAAALRSVIEPVVGEFGLVLEELTARGAGNHQTLIVTVDLHEDETGGVGLDTIAEVSRAVSEALDATDQDPEDAYLLEVASPGAARSLTEPRHWKRSRGRLLRIVPAEGEPYLARLEETDGVEARISRKKETKKGQPESYREPETIQVSDVDSAKVEMEFGH